jgi:hypothetical protein
MTLCTFCSLQDSVKPSRLTGIHHQLGDGMSEHDRQYKTFLAKTGNARLLF